MIRLDATPEEKQYHEDNYYDSKDFIFNQTKFNPKLWEEVKKTYAKGKKIKTGTIVHETLDDFASYHYDKAEEMINSARTLKHFMFGINGSFNPIKQVSNMYMDGLVFFTCRKEFFELLEQYSIERVYSISRHYWYISDKEEIV